MTSLPILRMIRDISGPWQQEPDYIKWIDAETGYQCMIRRMRLGHLCGYVRVPRGHRLHGRHYHGRVERRIDVHGGVTFSGAQRFKPGYKPRGHWFGFDCGHSMDLIPGMLVLDAHIGMPVGHSGIYKDVAYVRREVESFARQLRRHA